MAHEPRRGEGRSSEPFHRAARFDGEDAAWHAYLKSCLDVAVSRPETDISVYRMEIGELIGPVAFVGWYVALIGEQPDRALERRLEANLAAGQPMALPEEVVEMLRERHRDMTPGREVYVVHEPEADRPNR